MSKEQGSKDFACVWVCQRYRLQIQTVMPITSSLLLRLAGVLLTVGFLYKITPLYGHHEYSPADLVMELS